MNMINIKGRMVSEDTADIALQEYFKSRPEPPYQFKAADVARNNAGRTRIIVRDYEQLVSYDTDGVFQAGSQEDFEECGYKKIGVITDYIK